MITFEQVDFANDLDKCFGALFPEVSAYFVKMANAIANEDEAALAKFCACVIVELSQRGELISERAAKWIQLFGKLPEFDLLTQGVHSV